MPRSRSLAVDIDGTLALTIVIERCGSSKLVGARVCAWRGGGSRHARREWTASVTTHLLRCVPLILILTCPHHCNFRPVQNPQ